MAFAKGTASKEAQEFKRYIGVCPVTVVAVNPTKEEHEKLFNTTLTEDPIYVTEKEDANGKSYKNVRISLILKPDTAKLGFDIPLITMAMFITNQKQYGANSGKYQVVDKYGRFAWATEAEIASKSIPVYSNGKPADISNDYRIACVGEEDLTNFIRTFLCIPDITVWDNDSKTRVANKSVNPEACEGNLDNTELNKMFKGDFSGLRDIFSYQPNNKVKVCLGVRTDPASGRLFQTVYTKRFLSNSATNYIGLDKDFQADIAYAQAHGRAITTEYAAKVVQEYDVTPTDFTPSTTSVEDEMPFGDPTDNPSDPWA